MSTTTEPPVVLSVVDWARLISVAGLGTDVQDQRILGKLRATQPPPVPSAPVLSVEGDTVSWAALPGETSYAFAVVRNPSTTRDTTYQTVTGTSFTPPVVPGETVNYGLAALTPVKGPWAHEVSVTYPLPTPAPVKIAGLTSPIYSDYDGDQAYFLKDAVTLGVQAERVECWTAGEAKKAHDLLAAHGLKMLPLVNSYSVDPTNIAAWVQAAKEIAPYADLGVLEISNEAWWKGGYNRPALNGVLPEQRPGDWAKMWKAVLAAVPAVKIIVPVGLLASPDWIGGCNAAVPGIFGMVHGVAVHPYGNGTIDDGSKSQWHYGMWEGVAERLKALVGRDVPQWWTEVGQEIPAVTAEYQAKAVTRAFSDMRTHSFIEAVFWFGHKDWHPAVTSKDTGWGEIDENGMRRPSWTAYQAAAKALLAA